MQQMLARFSHFTVYELSSVVSELMGIWWSERISSRDGNSLAGAALAALLAGAAGVATAAALAAAC